MARQKISRVSIFKMLALEWDRRKIKREAKISERTFWNIKAEYNILSEKRKAQIKDLALEQGRVKARFEDYEFVQKWITRMKNDRIRSWRNRFLYCRKIWLILQKKNPKNWTTDDIKIRAISELRKITKNVFNYLVAVRSLRPDLKDEVTTKRHKPKPKFKWKYVYERIMEQGKLETFFKTEDFKKELIKRLHVTLGCREGTKGEGGILGLEWDRINWNKKTIDVYESKTGEGFYWLNCPLDLFGDRTFEMLKEYWIEQGKPKEGKIFNDVSYLPNGKELSLIEIYKETAEAIGEEYGREGITPHFARKLHACLLIDVDVPLEMVAGDGHFGIMGVGWTSKDTLCKYYLAFRKRKVREARIKARRVIFN